MLTVPIQRGLRENSFGGDHENDLSDLAITPHTISSLHLPEPLFSIPSSYSSIQQVDGAQPSKNHGHKPTYNRSSRLKPGIQFDDNHATGGMDIIPDASLDKPTKATQSHPYSGPRQIPHPRGTPGNVHESRFRSSADEKSKKREFLVPTVGAASSYSSPHNLSPVNSFRSQGGYDQDRSSPSTFDEFLRIINHKPWGNKNFQYMILWKPCDSDAPTELWVKAIDFAKSGKRAILEGYHLHHDLGPVRWPRDPRRQWRSSTSFGVQELKSALDERKQMLLDRGIDESEALGEINQERWKMRDEWQRTGRGWGSAMMIVKGRKKAWSIADSDVDKLGSSDYQDPGTSRGTDQGTREQEREWERPNPDLSPTSLPNIPEPGNPRRPDRISQEEVRSQFAFTSEDEREWREIFGPELFRSSVSLPIL